MTSSAVRTSSLPVGILRACRPKQWAKNVLVFVAPAAATALVFRRAGGGIDIAWDSIGRTLAAFAVFCVVASGTYLINDALDIDADRAHPTKRHRPIAAGVVPVRLAYVLAVVLIVSGVIGAWFVRPQFVWVVGLYIAQTVAYSYWLKHEAVLDLVALSSGFLLRLIGGAVAVDVRISAWFFIISASGSLFIAVGKRMAEKRELGDDDGEIRKTLAVYTEPYLRFLQSVSGSIVLLAYVQWAFERVDQHAAGATWSQLSILPFLVAILRYALLVEQGKGSAPEDVLLSDAQLAFMGLLWVVFTGISFYVG